VYASSPLLVVLMLSCLTLIAWCNVRHLNWWQCHRQSSAMKHKFHIWWGIEHEGLYTEDVNCTSHLRKKQHYQIKNEHLSDTTTTNHHTLEWKVYDSTATSIQSTGTQQTKRGDPATKAVWCTERTDYNACTHQTYRMSARRLQFFHLRDNYNTARTKGEWTYIINT